MGFETEINWYIVDNKDPKSLENLSIGDVGSFEKDNCRIYPTNIPLFLLNKDWEVLGAAEVTSYTPSNKKTTVNYQITEIFDYEVRRVLTAVIKGMCKKE
jgi:hypothetical protein